MISFLKRNLSKIGSSLALLGVLFLGLKLQAYSEKIDFSQISIEKWFFFSMLTLVYGVLCFLNALSWKFNLKHCGVTIKTIDSFSIYGVSQLAKYLPGNVFQFAGRQALGMANNINAKALIKSSFWELVMLCIGGASLSTLMIPILAPFLNSTVAMCMSALIIVLYLFLSKILLSIDFAKAALTNLTFTCISGISFLLIIKILNFQTGTLSDHEIIGAYIFAWLVGLVTPGAPAGVGIREVILLLLFKDSINNEALVITVLLGRLMTVSGDFIFYLLALLCGFLNKKQELE